MQLENLSSAEIARLQKTLTPRMTKYIPYTPTPKQRAFLLMNDVREILYGGAAGGGKALALDTPILTTEGWSTMEDLQVGDKVYSDSGKPAVVTAVSAIQHGHVVYRVSFDNGEEILADADHLWTLAGPEPYTITTAEIVEQGGGRIRKARKNPVTGEEQQGFHEIIEIVEVDSVPVKCIKVDAPTELFLAGKTMIPTHNSVAQLMAALQYVDVPGYAAILFRKTYADLTLPGALIDMSREWLAPFTKTGEVKWRDKEKVFIFPSGATLSFGYLETASDPYRYQGAEFQYIGIDEATHIMPSSYRYMHSRLRKPKNLPVPLRFRATTNPGGAYGEFYYERFFKEESDRVFIGAGLEDNPHLDSEAYKESLQELDPVTRAQLLEGNWEIREPGDMFTPSDIVVVPAKDIPSEAKAVRFWDMAATDPKKRSRSTAKGAARPDPDYTVGLKLRYHQGLYWVEDIERVQLRPYDTEKLIRKCAERDGRHCMVRMEQEPGASGAMVIDYYKRDVLDGFDFDGVRSTGSKVERAELASAAVQAGKVFISERTRHRQAFYEELELFPYGAHDDTVDAFTGAFSVFGSKSKIVLPIGYNKKYGSTFR